MTDHVECIVVGAGVVGLAIARALAVGGREVLVLEREGAIGTQTSARNSEVIHAGIHYADGSLKARLCREGRERLYAYCAEHGVNFRRCGKLVVACDESELPLLDEVQAHAEGNDVRDLVRLSAREAVALEPALSCAGALLSPSTGIIDSHGYMLALQGNAESAGAVFAFHAPVARIGVEANGLFAEAGGADATTLSCNLLVNAAGHNAPALARAMLGAERTPDAYLCKGNYFTLRGRAPFSRLIYPVAKSNAAGLGVHFTLDLGGQAKFGPDIEWIAKTNLDVDPARAGVFYPAIRRYWPGLPDDALDPGYAGIRPKISKPGEPPSDFRIDGPRTHGIPGLVNLFGIESPGLTSSLAIADHVMGLLAQ